MRRLGVIAVLLAASALTAQGAAALTFQPCGRPDGIMCATVTVPIARDGGVPGSINLYVEKEPAKSQPSQGALIALSGGPGEAATVSTTSFATRLAPGLATRDLITFDQRGTGSSGFLSCSSPLLTDTDWRRCLNELGPSQAYYSSLDSVDDIEAVRQALGVDRISLYGISYGTKVAVNYAGRYPTHVESLVLDSVVPPSGFDVFNRNNFAAVAPILREICATGCPGVPDPVGDLTRLAAKARNGLSLSAVEADGKIHTMTFREDLLANMFKYGTFSEVFRSRFPGAVHAALAGDGFPLGRLWLEINAGNTLDAGGTDSTLEFSRVLNHVTNCLDASPAWFRQTTIAQRPARVATELQAIGDAPFAPFDRTAVDGPSFPSASCVPWPLSPNPPILPASYPDVPVLVLNGLEDDNTPPDDARAVAALFPHASLVLVPDAGHGVAQTHGASAACVKGRIAQFFAGQQVGACPDVRPEFAIWPTPPRSLAAVKPVKHVAGTRGRTLAAVIDTVNDAYNTTYYTYGPNAGLRGGTFTTSSDRKILTFKNVSYVRGVLVSGSIDVTTALGMFKVTGTGSRGTVVFRPKLVVTGTLDGKKVTTSR